MLKLGTQKMPELALSLDTVLKIASNWVLLLGIFCMVASFPFYTMTIQKMNLATAVPLLSGGTFVLVAIISALFLKESLTIVNIFGILIIVIGIILCSYKA